MHSFFPSVSFSSSFATYLAFGGGCRSFTIWCLLIQFSYWSLIPQVSSTSCHVSSQEPPQFSSRSGLADDPPNPQISQKEWNSQLANKDIIISSWMKGNNYNIFCPVGILEDYVDSSFDCSRDISLNFQNPSISKRHCHTERIPHPEVPTCLRCYAYDVSNVASILAYMMNLTLQDVGHRELWSSAST